MAITPAILGAAAIGAGGSIMAGNAQAGAAKNATQAQMAMYNQTRSDLLPFMQGGSQAFGALGNLMGMGGPQASQNMLEGLRNSPGYQFAFDQGLQGVDRSAASRGQLFSGGQLKDVQQYGQGMADQLFGTYYNQQMGIAQLGENAAAQTGNAGATAAGNAGNAMMAGGTAQASGIAGAANQIGGILSNQNVMSSMFGSSSGSGASGALGSAGTLSDRRTKDNVVQIGMLDSGLPVYSFNYKGSDLPTMGVMADEVRRVAPHAVRRGGDGFDRVDYGAVSKLPSMQWKEAA